VAVSERVVGLPFVREQHLAAFDRGSLDGNNARRGPGEHAQPWKDQRHSQGHEIPARVDSLHGDTLQMEQGSGAERTTSIIREGRWRRKQNLWHLLRRLARFERMRRN